MHPVSLGGDTAAPSSIKTAMLPGPRLNGSPVDRENGHKHLLASDSSPSNLTTTPTVQPPPVRPRRVDDEAFVHNTAGNRSDSPSGPFQDAPDGDGARSGLDSGGAINVLPSSPIISDAHGKRGYGGHMAKEPPSDAFYYGSRSPTGTVFSNRGETPIQQYSRGIDSQDLTRIMRENTVLRAALEKASESHLSHEVQATALELPETPESINAEILLDHILQLQEDCSRLKVTLLRKPSL